MKLIIGLGNIGEKYHLTRHNVGFIVLDEYANRNNLDFKFDSKLEALIAETRINNEKVIFAKPTTYVNLSGNAVSKIMNFYKIELNDILVIYDDIDLDVGFLRVREKNGHGGHNGVRDIINHLKTRNFKRIRIGIGKDDSKELNHHVLGRFSKQETEKLKPAVLDSLDVIDMFVEGVYFKDIMTKFNTKNIWLKNSWSNTLTIFN